jgi:hypothetical protein
MKFNERDLIKLVLHKKCDDLKNIEVKLYEISNTGIVFYYRIFKSVSLNKIYKMKYIVGDRIMFLSKNGMVDCAEFTYN